QQNGGELDTAVGHHVALLMINGTVHLQVGHVGKKYDAAVEPGHVIGERRRAQVGGASTIQLRAHAAREKEQRAPIHGRWVGVVARDEGGDRAVELIEIFLVAPLFIAGHASTSAHRLVFEATETTACFAWAVIEYT